MLLIICEQNPPIAASFPLQGATNDIFAVASLNKLLNKRLFDVATMTGFGNQYEQLGT